nr:hypothetical protein [Nannocystis sp.]
MRARHVGLGEAAAEQARHHQHAEAGGVEVAGREHRREPAEAAEDELAAVDQQPHTGAGEEEQAEVDRQLGQLVEAASAQAREGVQGREPGEAEPQARERERGGAAGRQGGRAEQDAEGPERVAGGEPAREGGGRSLRPVRRDILGCPLGPVRRDSQRQQQRHDDHGDEGDRELGQSGEVVEPGAEPHAEPEPGEQAEERGEHGGGHGARMVSG